MQIVLAQNAQNNVSSEAREAGYAWPDKTDLDIFWAARVVADPTASELRDDAMVDYLLHCPAARVISKVGAKRRRRLRNAWLLQHVAGQLDRANEMLEHLTAILTRDGHIPTTMQG